MKRYIRATTYGDTVDRINALAEKGDIYAIVDILDRFPDGLTIQLSKESEATHTTSFDKVDGDWVEMGYDKYSSYDIADELVHGRYRYLISIKGTPKVKEMSPVPDRFKPKMWR